MSDSSDNNTNPKNIKEFDKEINNLNPSSLSSKNQTKNYNSTNVNVVVDDDDENEKVPVYTVNEIIDKIGYGLFHIYLLTTLGLLFMMEGCILIVMSFIMDALRIDLNMTRFQESVSGSIVFIGLQCGFLFWGILGDRYGRKDVIKVIFFVVIFSAVFSSISYNFWMLIPFMFLMGLGCAAPSVTMVLFVEFLPVKMRGFVMLLVELFWTVGAMYEAVLSWIVINGKNFYLWRIVLMFSIFPVLIEIVLLPFLPESIRYLSIIGDENEIRRILKWIEWINCKKVLPKKYKIKLIEKKERMGKTFLAYIHPLETKDKPLPDVVDDLKNENKIKKKKKIFGIVVKSKEETSIQKISKDDYTQF